MKKLITLVLLSMAISANCQKALLGTLVLQDNFIEFRHTIDTANQKVTNYHKPNQFPTFSLSYLKFRESNGYNRIFISGWHHTKIKDYETTSTSNGLNFVGGGALSLFSGRLGYARGIRLMTKNDTRFLFLEADLNAGFQRDKYQPYGLNQDYRSIWAVYTRLGANLVLHINYKNGFLRFMVMLPALQINSEHYRIQDSFYPSIVSETNSTYLDSDIWSHKGLEIGAGWFLGR